MKKAPLKNSAAENETALKTTGQRRINLIWEVTQSTIAVLSVGAGVFIMVYQAIFRTDGGQVPDVPTTLSSMIFLVLGFYFARTNHTRVGGVGAKDSQSRGESGP